MTTRFFKKGLFKKLIALIIIANFILTSVPISAYSSSTVAADNLRGRAEKKQNPGAVELAKALEKQALSEELVVGLELLNKDDLLIGGGKAVNLGEMMRIGIPVPPGYVTTPKAYRQFISEGVIEIDGKTMPLQQFIDERLEGLDYNNAVALNHAGEDIRGAIKQAKIPAELEKKIREAYAKLGNVAVAVRSSATAEDSQDASFAGQQATFLNVIGADNVVERVRDCVASLFEDRAILYRHEKNISHSTTYLCAAVQKMASQKTPKVSGVMFSVNVVTGSRNQITIEATPGLGEKVVAGEGTPDTFLVNRSTGELVIQNKTLVAKPEKIVQRDRASIKPGEKGTETVPTTPEERDNYSLTDAQALQLAKIAMILEAHYGFIVDVEWVIDEEGKLWIVQVRPEIPWNTKAREYPNQKMVQTSTVVPTSAETAKIVTAGLSAGARKAASDEVRVIKELVGVPENEIARDLAAQMEAFPQGGILVAKMTNPSYLPAMKKAGGIVTDNGGRTCHAALVARELKIPCVVGTFDATEKLTNGMKVTVDGYYTAKGVVYEGILPIEKHDTVVDLSKIPTTSTKLKVTTAGADDAIEAYPYSTLPSLDGVGLMRAEFALAKMPHVLAGSDYDRYYDPSCPEEERRRIYDKVIKDYGAQIKAVIDEANRTRHPKEQYRTFREYYIGTLAESIMGVAAEQHRGQLVIYRTTDFKTNEYRRLIGGSAYEPQENNPMLGYRGIYRMLSPEYREAFEMEIEAIKKARQVFKNIWVMFPVCRSPEEIKAAEDLFAKHGLVRGQDGLEFIMMFEVPDNFFRMKKYLQYVDGLSIGSNDLTQLALGTGRDNGILAALGLFDEANPALLNMIGWGIQVADKEGKSTGICGDAPSANLPYSRHLVRFGIGSISVTQGVIPQVAIEIQKAEEEAEKLGIKGAFFSVERYERVKHLLTDLDKYPAHIVDWEEFDTMGKPEKAVASSVDAAELIRAIGIHPLALMQYARGEITDTALKQQIETKLAGMPVKDFVVDTVYKAMKEKADRAPAGQMVVYTTDDLLMTDYKKLSGAGGFEFDDENPITGIFGLVRVLSKDYRDFFAWQLEGLHNAYTEQPQRKFAIRFDGVIETKQIKDALDVIRAAGFEPGKTIQVGMELRTPGNVANLKRFINEGQLNFLSENRDAFLAYNLALDPGSQYVDEPQANKDDSFEAAQRYWTNVAQRMNIHLVQFEAETASIPAPIVIPVTPVPVTPPVPAIEPAGVMPGAIAGPRGADRGFITASEHATLRAVLERLNARDNKYTIQTRKDEFGVIHIQVVPGMSDEMFKETGRRLRGHSAIRPDANGITYIYIDQEVFTLFSRAWGPIYIQHELRELEEIRRFSIDKKWTFDYLVKWLEEEGDPKEVEALLSKIHQNAPKLPEDAIEIIRDIPFRDRPLRVLVANAQRPVRGAADGEEGSEVVGPAFPNKIALGGKLTVGGNWKLRKDITTEAGARAKAEEFKVKFADVDGNAEVVLFVQDKWMKAISEELKGSNIKVGVQSFHFDPNGDINTQIEEAVSRGAEYAMVGHSMHRNPTDKAFPPEGETKKPKPLTNEGANKIAKAILEDGRLKLWYVIGIDEKPETPLAEQEGYIREQINNGINIGLDGISKDQLTNIIITAEPMADISTPTGEGKIDPKTYVNFEKVEMLAKRLTEALIQKFGITEEEVNKKVNTGYGASAGPGTAAKLLSHPYIFNILPGGMSLEADNFYGTVVNAIIGKYGSHKADVEIAQKLNKETVKLRGIIQAQDKIVYDGTSVRYGNFVNALRQSKDQGNVIMGANAILENGGTTALKMLKGTNYNVIIWAQDEAMLEKLQAMGIEEVTKTLMSEERPENLKYLLMMSRKNGIPTTLVVSPLDRKEIDLEEIRSLGVQVINLETPNVKEMRINSMPLVIARAIAGIAKDNRIIDEFKKLTTAYGENAQISAENLAVVNNLATQISTVPLVPVNPDIAQAAEIYKTTSEGLGGAV